MIVVKPFPRVFAFSCFVSKRKNTPLGWLCPINGDGSPINDILDKESFTLEEILAQDEVLQEVKSLNIKLVDL